MQIDRSLLTAAVALLGMGTSGAYAATEIQWWHAMSGQLGEKANEIAANFNAQNQDYQVVPGLQGRLHRDHDRVGRGVPRRPAAAHTRT